MEPINLVIEVTEKEPTKPVEYSTFNTDGLSFYECRITLNGKAMQMKSPLAEKKDRQEMLMGFIEKAWAEISTQAFPPSETPLIIAG